MIFKSSHRRRLPSFASPGKATVQPGFAERTGGARRLSGHVCVRSRVLARAIEDQ